MPRPKLGSWTERLDALLLHNSGKAGSRAADVDPVFEKLRGLGYDGG